MEPKKGPRLRIESVAELLSKPQPQQEWLIENIWTDKSRGLIAGNPGVGKTWIALDMLIAVSSGGLCMGKYPVKKGAGLLIEEEASELNLARRLHAMARARGLADVDLTNLYHITRQQANIPGDAVEICHFMMEHKITLAVFDSLRAVHSAKENSSDEMRKVLDSFGRINTISGASVLLIHHLNKQQEGSHTPLFERLRGSTDLWAWRDCLIGVEGEEDSTLATCSFQFRDAEAQDPIKIQRCVGELTGAIALEVTDPAESEEFIDKSALITAYLKSQYGGVIKEAIFKVVKGRKSEFVQVFNLMKKRGLVVRNGKGWTVPDLAGTHGNTGT